MKAIITDLDGTLLHSDKSISDYTIAILNECRRRGLPIIAASARPLRFILGYRDRFCFDAVTATNGAVVSLPNERLEFGIPCETGEKIISAIIQDPDMVVSIETSRGLYANRDIPAWNPVFYDKFPTLPENIVLYKILASHPHGLRCERIENAVTDDVYYTVAENRLIQIMSRDATKWNGIRHMLSSYGLSPADALYFGDDNDDIEPIRNCGLGIAVSNAIPSVLDAADVITESNDSDGVAKYIEKYIL